LFVLLMSTPTAHEPSTQNGPVWHPFAGLAQPVVVPSQQPALAGGGGEVMVQTPAQAVTAQGKRAATSQSVFVVHVFAVAVSSQMWLLLQLQV
jgi:hypothetical protein